MKYIFILIIILIIILVIPVSTFEDSEMNNIYKTAKQLGENYLEIMKQNDYFSLKNPAVMFDIDDTLISYSGKPIKPIISLLNSCIKNNLTILIITARDSLYLNQTIEELKKNKIKYDFLYLRNSQTDNYNTFKSEIKKKLAEENDIITIMSIGDNIVDIDGNHSGYFIKLPNNFDKNLYHLNTHGVPEIVIS